MSRDGNWFQMLPTTDRSADILARRHGYKSVADLANSLPPRASVLDVGAGASSLGSEVAGLRPDIHWTNLDFSYYSRQILEDVRRNAPPNLAFMAGDATRLDVFIKPASMDAVFSYWLFSHLSLYDQQTALIAAIRLYEVAKPGAVVAVGPRKQPMLHPATLLGRSWRIRKDERLAATVYAHEVLCQTELSVVNRYLRSALDAAAFKLFGTSRYMKGTGMKREIYDPRANRYIPWYNPWVISLAGGLLLGTAIRLIQLRDRRTNKGS